MRRSLLPHHLFNSTEFSLKIHLHSPSWLTRDRWSDIRSKSYRWCSFATSARGLDCYFVQRPCSPRPARWLIFTLSGEFVHGCPDRLLNGRGPLPGQTRSEWTQADLATLVLLVVVAGFVAHQIVHWRP